MQNPRRSPTNGGNGGAPDAFPADEPARTVSDSGASGSSPPGAKPYVGDAMKALFESSDVSIRRGDETRVMSRAQEALAEIQRKSGRPTASSAPAEAEQRQSPSSRPPAPRVDAVLWIVLALGLFAIAGWMLAYAL